MNETEKRGAGMESHMKIATIAGFALIALGAIALVYQGITYTTRETVVDIGPIHATADREKTLPVPPILGLALVIGGAVVLYTSGRRRVS
jgi:hypothetical protein